MYQIFNEKEPEKYDQSFLNQISTFGRINYDKKEMMTLFGPSIDSPETEEKIFDDLNTPGKILYKYYEDGLLHVEYTDKYLMATNESYVIKKKLKKLINDYYGL